MKKVSLIALLGAMLVSIAPLTKTQAQTYNPTSAFSITNSNPNGVWGYGYRGLNPGDPILPYDVPSNNLTGTGNILTWQSSTIIVAGVPSIYKNNTAVTQFGTPSGFLSLHPGPTTDSVLTFTVPVAGNYSVNTQYFAGDGGVTFGSFEDDVYGISMFATNTTSNPTHSLLPTFYPAGSHLRWIVNQGSDGFAADSTPVSISITGPAVAAPEPATLSLLALGLFGGAGIVRRRRGEKA
jgi:PEP-CTERM motif